MENGTHQTIFWCIQIFVVLGLVLLIVSRIASMESKMNRITADIKTPAVAGQKLPGKDRCNRCLLVQAADPDRKAAQAVGPARKSVA